MNRNQNRALAYRKEQIDERVGCKDVEFTSAEKSRLHLVHDKFKITVARVAQAAI